MLCHPQLLLSHLDLNKLHLQPNEANIPSPLKLEPLFIPTNLFQQSIHTFSFPMEEHGQYRFYSFDLEIDSQIAHLQSSHKPGTCCSPGAVRNTRWSQIGTHALLLVLAPDLAQSWQKIKQSVQLLPITVMLHIQCPYFFSLCSSICSASFEDVLISTGSYNGQVNSCIVLSNCCNVAIEPRLHILHRKKELDPVPWLPACFPGELLLTHESQ